MKKLVILAFMGACLSACKNSTYLFGKGKILNKEVFDVQLPVVMDANLIIVTLEIEGEDYRFLFDTGAPMVVDKSLRQKLKMKKVTQKSVSDSQGNRQPLDFVKMPPFKLKHLTAEGFIAVEADLKKSPILYCLNLDGILGANFMQKGFWELNAVDTTLRFTNDFNRLNTDSVTATIPFTTKNTRTPVITARVNETEVPNITFDTGKSGIFSLPAKFFKTGYQKAPSVLSVGYQTSGLYGSKKDSIYTRNYRFALGGDSIAALPIHIQGSSSKKLLGMGYLKHYRVILNWQKQQIYLQPLKPLKISAMGRFPFYPKLQDSVVTVGVLYANLGGEGENPSVTLGDTIQSVSNIDLSRADNALFCEILEKFRAKDTLQIKLAGQSARTLTRIPLFD
jgi:hypothetical protein